MTPDLIIRNCHIATMTRGGLGENLDGVLVVTDGKISWVGSETDLPSIPSAEEYDAEGAWLLPGLIDCHTHLVYAGCRAHEYEARLCGTTYQEICNAGGGILSTVQATREATEDELFQVSFPRLMDFVSQGVTTIDIKSGYGLTLESELKMMRVARRLGSDYTMDVKVGLLAAHTCPPEFTGRADDYIDYIINEILPVVAEQNLADYVDAFTETVGFTPEQTKKLFTAAQRYGLPVRLHADQLSNLEGASLAADFMALSADHVEFTSEESVAKMANAGTVAGLLPTAFYFLRETQLPPIEELRKHSVPMAVSTDCNPGTSPSTNLLLAMNMASTLFGLTPVESLLGVTINAAKALGIQDKVGSLEVGKQADLSLWKIDHPRDLVAKITAPRLKQSWKNGRLI
ncbi:MAG: imidazolonepropionase [Fimbriimonadaceae bacterium]|nr:MAG: imidazolonepropionase [Fimbriimonadaceae bacterium]